MAKGEFVGEIQIIFSRVVQLAKMGEMTCCREQLLPTTRHFAVSSRSGDGKEGWELLKLDGLVSQTHHQNLAWEFLW